MVRRDPLLALALVALAALAASVLLVEGADAQEASNLTLGPVTCEALDTDDDGLDDSVRVVTNVTNNDLERSEVYAMLVSLWFSSTRIDALTASDLLDSNTTVQVMLVVGTTDSSSRGDHTVNVELHSGDLTGPIVGRDETTRALHPLGAYALEVTAVPDSAVVLENESARFNVTVLSTSNNPTGVALSATSTLGWGVGLSATMLQLDPGQSAEFAVTVRVPHNAAPGTLERVLALAVAERNLTATASVLLSVQVPIHLYELSLEVADPSRRIQAGGALEFAGLVQNMGNNKDTVSMERLAPTGWTVTVEPTSLTLDRGTGAPVRILVTAPSSLAGSGTVGVDVTARSQGLTTFVTRTLTLTYDTPDLSIDAPNVTVSPRLPLAGEETTVDVAILNHGSGPAMDVVVALLVDGTEVGRTTLPTIDVGERVHALLRWTAVLGYHRLTVRADPDGAIPETEEDDNEAEVGLNVVGTDLVVTSSDMTMEPGYPAEGDVAALSMRVRNIRALASGPFDVTLAIDGTLVRTYDVDPGVEGVSNVTLVHDWTVVAGRHSFKVVLDPGGAVAEQDEANNEATRQFTGNARPVASLSLGDESVEVGKPVQLVGSGSTDPDGRVRQWFYDYGDGTNSGWSFLPNGTHSYKDKGEYTVRLYVRDETATEGAQPATATVKVTEPSDVDEPSPGAGALAAVAAVAMATALVLTRARRRRGR